MSNSLLFGIPAISIAVAVAFICFFGDFSAIFSWQGLLAFMLYSALSLTTGLRYRLLITEITRVKPDLAETVAIPAAMNLMSFILPVKGGGLWLLFYLKTAHSIDLLRGSWLAAINVSLMIAVAVALYISWALFDDAKALPVLSTTLLIFFAISLSSVVFHNRISAPEKSIGIAWASRDAALVTVYLLILFALVYVISPSRESDIVFALVVMTLLSLVFKVTPGNIGVLEGFGLILYTLAEEHGSAFTSYVAAYRVFSIFHAAAIGAPALVHLTNKRELRSFFASIRSKYARSSD